VRALLAAAFACALAAAVRPAAAEDPAIPTDAQKEEAKRHFLDGRAHYASREFAEAAEHFIEAYELTQAPELLYNLARCYERLGEEERAAEQYEMYLRMSPDAEDRVEVEQRIAELVGGPERKPAEGGEVREAAPAAPEEEGREIRLRVASGVDFPITGEWSRKSVPLDVALLFGMSDWLQLGFGLAFVGFVGDEPAGETGFPTGEFALQGELAVRATIKGRFAFAARIDVAPTWIFRDHRDSVFWLAGRGGVGLHIDLWKSFGVVIEGVAAVGPVFNRDAEIWDDWPKVSLAVDAGPRIGITYVF
jgi:tetratricopeptide (TPR) repeat protein